MKLSLPDRRAEVVRLHGEGTTKMEICRLTGLSWPAVNRAINLWREGGDDALQPAKRGRKPGTGRKLSPEQEANIRQCMRRRPVAHGLGDWLWTREAVQRLLDTKFSVQLTDRAVGNYLKRWGVIGGGANNAPASRCTPRVRAWLDQNVSELLLWAQAADAEIYWCNKRAKLDAAWGGAAAQPGDPPAPSGSQSVESDVEGESDEASDDYQGPSLAASRSPPKQVVISVSNNQGKLFWLVVSGAFNEHRQRQFLRALVHDTVRRQSLLIRRDMKDFARAGDRWYPNPARGVSLYPPLETLSQQGGEGGEGGGSVAREAKTLLDPPDNEEA